ncbi:MAG: hypothetical protein MUE54_07305 [Anaerolineae bacterium]|jgi:hypothetical protein|nr:hypothetical protein [Anaerolineae bacterium]
MSLERPPERATHTSKARERIQKRKTRTQQVTAVSPSRRPRNAQLAPKGALRLPKVDMKYIRPLLFGVAAFLFMGMLIVVVGLFSGTETVTPQNAIWIGSDWTYRQHSDDEMNGLVNRLRDAKIGTVYARVSELNFDGTWTGIPSQRNRFDEVESDVKNFVTQFKAAYPEATLYGSVHFRVDIGPDGYRLNKEAYRVTVADFSRQVVDNLGFDGVMLVVEPVVGNNNTDFLDLVRRVRSAIGEDVLLALAVPPDWSPEDADIPKPFELPTGTAWDTDYKKRVALLRADQLVVLAYNSYLKTASDYQNWMAYQVQTYATVIQELGIDTQILVGLPAYQTALPAHDARVENIETGANGVKMGLARAGDAASVISGVALYALWDMTDIEWELYKQHWLTP